jgi:hypothetical protein
MAGAEGTSRRDLHELAKRLAEWRRTHAVGARIPDWLWRWAAEVAAHSGVSRTATTLKLDYNGLRRRVAEETTPAPPLAKSRLAGGFLELDPGSIATCCQCTIEFEKPCGSRLRIELRGSAPDIESLSRSFWESP